MMRMYRIRYALKNINVSIKKSGIRFFFNEVFILCCFILVFFSIGVAGHYAIKQREEMADEEQKNVFMQFENTNSEICIGDLYEFFDNLSDSSLITLEYAASYIEIDGVIIDCVYEYRDGAIVRSDGNTRNIVKNNWLYSGRCITEDEYNTGQKVAMIPLSWIEEGNSIYDAGDNSIMLGTDRYSVIATLDDTRCRIPITALPKDAKVIDLCLGYDVIVTRTIYEDVKEAASEVFGEFTISDMKFDGDANARLFKQIMLQQIVIIIMICVNLTVLLISVLLSNVDKMKIYYTCGMTTRKIVDIYLVQWSVMVLPMYMAAVVLFDRFLKGMFVQYYSYMNEFVSTDVYLLVGFVFVVYCYIIGRKCIELSMFSKKIGRFKRL